MLIDFQRKSRTFWSLSDAEKVAPLAVKLERLKCTIFVLVVLLLLGIGAADQYRDR